jgi:catechol 2,3-dioxygenase-like lactoylglutathione lyase family enzyme
MLLAGKNLQGAKFLRRKTMNLKLAVVTLWTEDVQKTSDFYQHVLGLPLIAVDQGRPHFDFGGGYLVLLEGKPHQATDSAPPRFPLIAFAVDDLHSVIHQLKSHNVEMPWGVEEDRHSTWVMFYDPGGNLIEVALMGKHA